MVPSVLNLPITSVLLEVKLFQILKTIKNITCIETLQLNMSLRYLCKRPSQCVVLPAKVSYVCL